jgi:broad specificity phosphatase PhoE
VVYNNVRKNVTSAFFVCALKGEKMKFWEKISVFSEREHTKIIIVRHGESLGNLHQIMLGHTDVDLAPRGFVQAEACAEYLKNEKIDAIYSSDLIRAMHTAEPHAKLRGLEIQPSRQLRECYVGDWENVSLDEIVEKWPDLFFEGWRKNFGTFRIPGGESVQEAASRFHDEVLRIARDNIGKTVLIAAHAAVIRGFWGKITKTPPEELASTYLYPTNASCSFVWYNGGELVPLEYSVDEHLSEIGTIKFKY